MLRFDKIIYGPVHSRRLGISLGVNLLPADAKICSFNCIYCECGFNTAMNREKNPSREGVKQSLAEKLCEMQAASQKLDVITFAGNGEPTLHPDFEGIIDDCIALRNRYFPDAKVSVLSNATRIDKANVFSALNKVDNNILKFDSATDQSVKLIDQPVNEHFSVENQIKNLKKFNGQLIIQTMFLRGNADGQNIDNTGDAEVEKWLQAMKEISPRQIMIYSLDRETPVKNLQKITAAELNIIAEKAKKLGLKVVVTE
jgi:wyosine [tRNA(Phe)-imidazoG37] synthetase (radical SAM superfamily)